MDFSFSGIETAVINLNHKNPNINKADLCASFEKTTTEMLIDNVKKAIDETGIKKVVLARWSISKFIYKKKIPRARRRRTY